MSQALPGAINLTSGYPRAPKVIRFGERLVSASDFGEKETEELLRNRKLSDEKVTEIMTFRLLCKMGHGYGEIQTRRSGDRYIDHTNGVALMILLEFEEADPVLIKAAMGHDFLEDVKLSKKYSPEIIKRVAGNDGEEVVYIIRCVTNPTKTGNTERDNAQKSRHYTMIGDNIKASKIKVADRCYNLRTLEVHQKNDSDITDGDIVTAKKQLEETENLILPIAQKIGGKYFLTLQHEVNELRKKITLIETPKKTNTLCT